MKIAIVDVYTEYLIYCLDKLNEDQSANSSPPILYPDKNNK